MEVRPFIILKFTATDKILEIAGWVALAMLWCLFLYAISILPDTVPMQFDGSGNISRYGDKMEIIFLPGLATVGNIFLTVLLKFPQHFNYPVRITPANAFVQYRNATRMIRTIKIIIGIVFSSALVMITRTSLGQHDHVSIWFLPMMLAVIFVPLGYFVVTALRAK